MKSNAFALALVLPACLLSLTGCGNTNGPEIRGIVTLDGQPLPEAKVKFLPATDDPTLPAALTMTNAEGKFEILPDEDTGATLPPGNYKVVVSKLVDRQGKAPENLEDLGQLEASGLVREMLPARYSSASATTLDAEIKPETGELKYELTTK